jgi:WD40 repeat protein
MNMHYLSRLVILLAVVLLSACGNERSADVQWEHSQFGSYAAAYSPDGRYALVGDIDLPAKLWDLGTNQIKYAWQNNTEVGTTTLVAFSGDSKVAATVESDTVVLWNMADGEPMMRIAYPVKVKAIALSQDGGHMLVALYDRTAVYYDVINNAVRRIFKHDGKPVSSPIDQLINAVALSPGGQYALTGGDDQAARLWDLNTGKIKRAWKHKNSVNIVQFSPDGKSIVTGAGNDQTYVWDVKTGQQKFALRTASWPAEYPLPDFPAFKSTFSAIAFSRDGKKIVSGHPSQKLCLWQTSDGKKLDCWQVSRRDALRPGVVLQAVGFSYDGKSVYSESGNGIGQMWRIN